MRTCPLCSREYQGTEIKFCAEDGQALVERKPAAERSALPISASLAMTLFAHRFIENLPPEKHGVASFCQPDVQVKSWRLVTEVPMITFWHLREINCIRFTQSFRQGFVSSSPTLVIEANPAGQVNFPGLEYEFWEIIKHSPPGMTVERVFKRFLGGHSMSPEKHLIDRLIAWMIQYGYGRPDNSPKPFIRFGHIPLFEKFAPDCRRIAAEEQAAQIIHRNWVKFRADEPELFYYLFDDVVDAGIDRTGNTKVRSSDYYSARSFRDHGRE